MKHYDISIIGGGPAGVTSFLTEEKTSPVIYATISATNKWY